jgi:hypothetical protein
MLESALVFGFESGKILLYVIGWVFLVVGVVMLVTNVLARGLGWLRSWTGKSSQRGPWRFFTVWTDESTLTKGTDRADTN